MKLTHCFSCLWEQLSQRISWREHQATNELIWPEQTTNSSLLWSLFNEVCIKLLRDFHEVLSHVFLIFSGCFQKVTVSRSTWGTLNCSSFLFQYTQGFFFCFICKFCNVDHHINKLLYFLLWHAAKVAPKIRCAAAEKHFWSNKIFVFSWHGIKTRGQ